MKVLTSTILLAAGLFAAGTARAQFYTAPTGTGGTWNLYEVGNNVVTWKAAHQTAVAKQAASTGVAGVAGNTTTGHRVPDKIVVG